MKLLHIFSIYSLLFSVIMLFSCTSESADLGIDPGTGNTGTGGSFARFIAAGDFLYIVDNKKIKTLSTAVAAEPTVIHEQEVGEGIESLFRLGEKLFIGSSSGLYLYAIGADGIPVQQGQFPYDNLFPIYPCDPVVANDQYAYVTLNTTVKVEQCNRTAVVDVNSLNIFDVSDIQQPYLVAQYDMNNPQGVGLDGNLLFLCENEGGLKVFDVSNPSNIQLIEHLQGIAVHDVIPLNGLLLVVGKDNVYEVDYTDLNNIRIISQIPIGA